ncbi:MAG TPA: metallophosphoesterase [Pyrinomonadaceae bacterium]|jgi:predicted MPP superfamily phosphohydrolase
MTDDNSSPKLTASPEYLRVAVLSDLHAYDHLGDAPMPPSSLCTTDVEDQVYHHPVASLLNLIDADGLQADILMCCGDMGDKARPAGIKYVWDKLQIIKAKLGADLLAVTAGNHDVDSRFQYTEYDAKGLLQSLVPPFPLDDLAQSNKYWARNYVALTKDDYRIVILNSSAYHGHRDGEFEHGRISPKTVEALKLELEVMERDHPKSVNILLCHHHPHKHMDIEDDDYSTMEGAHKLLQLLESGEYGNWIVIHGHKHHPRICYAAGGSGAPVIFSAGSFSATLYPDLASQGVRNQFYIIEFPLSKLAELGLGLAGTFRAWDWSKGKGWLRASDRSGLPSIGGFGNRENVDSVATSIATYFASRTEFWLPWEEISGALPTIKYLLPNNLELVLKRLEVRHGLKVTRDSDGFPAQIGQPV